MSDNLKPCPFCGGKAEIIHIDEGENAGGSCVCCTQCMASGNVEFEFKENFVSNWNRRATPANSRAEGIGAEATRLLDFIRDEGPCAKEWEAISDCADRLRALLQQEDE